MLTLAALIALGGGTYGLALQLAALRAGAPSLADALGDVAILAVCGAIALTALHSLACLWSPV